MTGAMLKGTVHELRDVKADSIDRGGCVDGVSISFVRAVSRGERIMLAIPVADTATARETAGDSEDSMSYPPNAVVLEENAENCDVRPGSGKASMAARKDLEKEVNVENNMEYT